MIPITHLSEINPHDKATRYLENEALNGALTRLREYRERPRDRTNLAGGKRVDSDSVIIIP